MIKRNQKGLTLFEMLISISVGSVLIMMLMGIMSSVLLTKNHVEYNNRIASEMHDIQEYLTQEFFRLGYRSIIADHQPEEGLYILRLTNEYEIEETQIEDDYIQVINEQYILMLDVNEGALYYGLYNGDPATLLDRSQTRISSNNLRFHAGSEMVMLGSCLYKDPRLGTAPLDSERLTNPNLCASAYIHFNVLASYRLSSGNELQPLSYKTTLFY